MGSCCLQWKFADAEPRLASGSRIGRVLVTVEPKVASLAHRFEIIVAAVLWRMVEMRGCQHDD
jgi:hypothetical protein